MARVGISSPMAGTSSLMRSICSIRRASMPVTPTSRSTLRRPVRRVLSHDGAPPCRRRLSERLHGLFDSSFEPLAFRLTLAGPIDTIDIAAMITEFEHALPAYRPRRPTTTGRDLRRRLCRSPLVKDNTAPSTMRGERRFPLPTNTSGSGGGVRFRLRLHASFSLVLGAVDCRPAAPGPRHVSDLSGVERQPGPRCSITEPFRATVALPRQYIVYANRRLPLGVNDRFDTDAISTATLDDATAGADEAVDKGVVGSAIAAAASLAPFVSDWNVFAEYRYTSYGTSTISLPFSQLTQPRQSM